MGSLIVTLLVIGVTVTVVLWAGTVFLHGFWYTEASTAINWQAPAAGAAITLFYFLWCLINANAEGATRANVPYTTIFLFSNEVTKHPKPVERLVAIKKTGERDRFKRTPVSQNTYEYRHESTGKPYSPIHGYVAIETEEGGKKVRYELVKGEEGRRFVCEEGWAIREDGKGIDGNPTSTRAGLVFVNWLINLLHYGVWFACLWLLLRFQLSHALGLAFVFWLVMTVFVVPLMLGQAGGVAQGSGPAPKTVLLVNRSPGRA